jgi:hypothetical protein
MLNCLSLCHAARLRNQRAQAAPLPPVQPIMENGTARKDHVPYQRLCELCKQLQLMPEKFSISQEPEPADGKVVGGSMALMNPAQLISGRQPICRDINSFQRRDCALCSLISDALGLHDDRGTRAEDVRDGKCFIDWDLDGPHVDSTEGVSNTSRRLRISWTRIGAAERKGHNRGQDEQIHLIYMPSSLSDNATKVHQSASPVLDRDEYPRTESLILRWLGLCESNHKGQHPLSQGEWLDRFLAFSQGTSMGVIDVVDKKLCSLPVIQGKHARFVALSYVWGQNSQSKHRHLWTTRQNVLSRLEKNGLKDVWDTFPKTIRDAIQLVHSLGETIRLRDPGAAPLRYIWIDLLCIVQDSRLSWKANADNMAMIYGNAYFTICAADGDSSDAGLLALNPVQRDRPLRRTIIPGLPLLVSKSSESIIDASEWSHRAWTFQERILSSRCVVFAGKRVYFQCRQTNLSQDDNLDISGNENGMSSAWRLSPLRTLSELEHRPIRSYMSSVQAYTGRNLSHPEDILNAFKGVSQLMEEYLGADLLYGLPTSHFDLGLLWKPLAGKVRRTPENLRRF